MNLSRWRSGLAWRWALARRYWFFLSTFRNGLTLARQHRGRRPCDRAVCWDGAVLRHPRDRAGLTETLLELWHEQVYTRDFYRPRPGDVVIDAGANVGIFSVWMARHHPRCRVLAFEPFAENFHLLRDNLRGAGATSVEAFAAGISGAAGFAGMTPSDRSLDHRVRAAGPSEPDAVRLYSFADVLAMTGAERIAFCKMDIEGSEYDVFSAVTDAELRRVGRFAIEYHESLRPGVLALLQDRLAKTHTVRVQTDAPDVYGMLFATLK